MLKNSLLLASISLVSWLHKKLEIQNLRYHHLPGDSNVVSWTYNISNGEEQIRYRTNNIPRERLVALVKEGNKKNENQ